MRLSERLHSTGRFTVCGECRALGKHMTGYKTHSSAMFHLKSIAAGLITMTDANGREIVIACKYPDGSIATIEGV